MVNLFTVIFYQPIFNLLVWLYDIIPGHDIGLAIIALTVIIRLILLPLSRKSIESQKALQDLQPKIEEIKVKYADNKEAQGKAMMNVYKDNKVNPLSSCLPLLIQLPFLWAVYRVFRAGLSHGSLDLVYSFISKPAFIQSISFGHLDLARPSWVLAVLAGLAQFWQTRMLIASRPPLALRRKEGAKDEDMTAMLNKQMLYIMPAMTIIIGVSLPGGLTLYWLVTTVVTALQQVFIFNKILGKKKNPQDIANTPPTLQ